MWKKANGLIWRICYPEIRVVGSRTSATSYKYAKEIMVGKHNFPFILGSKLELLSIPDGKKISSNKEQALASRVCGTGNSREYVYSDQYAFTLYCYDKKNGWLLRKSLTSEKTQKTKLKVKSGEEGETILAIETYRNNQIFIQTAKEGILTCDTMTSDCIIMTQNQMYTRLI